MNSEEIRGYQEKPAMQKEISDLKAALAEAQKFIPPAHAYSSIRGWAEFPAILMKLESENSVLKSALEFYADEKNQELKCHEYGATSEYMLDGGARARAALEGK